MTVFDQADEKSDLEYIWTQYTDLDTKFLNSFFKNQLSDSWQNFFSDIQELLFNIVAM